MVKFYGIPDDEFGIELRQIFDERKHRLDQLLKKEEDGIDYEYDFSVGWEHKIILEKILSFCVKAKGSCPPEEIG